MKLLADPVMMIVVIVNVLYPYYNIKMEVTYPASDVTLKECKRSYGPLMEHQLARRFDDALSVTSDCVRRQSI